MSLGQRIRESRSQADLTQYELAEACGVRQLAISQWERDKTVPRADQLATIAKRCAVSPGWLLAGSGEMEPSAEAAA